MQESELLERLQGHRTVSVAPREELVWLARNGYYRETPAGSLMYESGKPIGFLAVILKGHIDIRVERGGAYRRVMEWHAGDVTGTLPFSRMKAPPGESRILEKVEAVHLDSAKFPELIRECPGLTAVFVHLMLDRARVFRASDLQEDKLASLGRLAAGLAHELNNPASAAARSAERLSSKLGEAELAYGALARAGLSDAEHAVFERMRNCCAKTETASFRSPFEQAERVEEFENWLTARGSKASRAESLADTELSIAQLEEFAAAFRPQAWIAAIDALAANCTTRRLAADIGRAAGRVHELVAAVKGFTYVDQSTAPKPVDLAKGILDTLTLLRSKARGRSVQLVPELASDLPVVVGVGGELNQVWANLIENAIDAAPSGGSVTVRTGSEGKFVVVRVIDDGPGIPDEVRKRIFEPFFTTKPVGEGTGLGLVISNHLVRQHLGELEIESRPGRTEFRVRLPAGEETIEAKQPDSGGG
ncbi:MAG: ATP-binding protein [Thermoanaerobaculia bacterium]